MALLIDKAYQKMADAVKNQATTSLEDALFLTKESRNMDHVKRFAKLFGEGFISHPMSWWATNIQIMAYLGAFGKRQQHLAIIRQTIFSSLISFGISNPQRTGKFLFWFKTTKLEDSLPATLGRFAGGALVTSRVIFNKKIRKNIKPGITTSAALFSTRLIHVTYGQAMLAISEGIRSLENILFAMITGINAKLDSSLYYELENFHVDLQSCYEEYSEVQTYLLKLSHLNTQAGYYEYKNSIFR